MDQDEMTWHKGLCLYVSDPKLPFHTHTPHVAEIEHKLSTA